MSDSAQKRRTNQKSLKTQSLPEEQTSDQFDRLAGDVGTPEADSYNQKADDQQQIHGQDLKYEKSEENYGFPDFEELDPAREILMILERDWHVSFKEVEAVREYINLKLTQKVSRQDSAQRIRS